MVTSPTAVATQPPHSAGPLPKRDSVQALVSLMSCPSATPSTPTLAHATVRGVDTDGNAHSMPVTENVNTISLSDKRLHSISLGGLASSVVTGLREISLAANCLHIIDLAPLSWCPSLTVLTLNSNRITSIDLSPLAACHKIERIWLHDNCLERLDLSPLSSCKNIRSLYLEDNSIHDHPIDLTPLQASHSLRSLRLGGNKLAGTLNLTPLLQCPSLSVFNVDATVKLVADADSSQARASPALRRVVLDIKFNPPSNARSRRSKGLTTPPISPPPSQRCKSCPSSDPSTKPEPSTKLNNHPGSPNSNTLEGTTVETQSNQPLIKVLLVGFRRLARYSAEDSLSRCGKVIIRASNHSVATSDPSLLLDSHVILLYSPPEKIIRQVSIVAGHIPVAVVGTERYRSMADSRHQELLTRFNFYLDPIDNSDAKLLHYLATKFARGEIDIPTVRSVSSSQNLSTSECNTEAILMNKRNMPMGPMRKTRSESTLPQTDNEREGVNIELEHIEDIDDEGKANLNRHADLISKTKHYVNRGTSEIRQRLNELRSRQPGRSWGSFAGYELSDQGRSKLLAERSAIEASFSELGGYATGESCFGIARICGLAKCSAPLLFRSALGSTFEIESTTPEAGVPNTPMERKKRISCDAFLAYWDSRLKSYDGEERLSNVLEDSHFTRLGAASNPENVGHSLYGAPPSHSFSNASNERSITFPWSGMSGGPGDSTANMRTELWCPCDAGIEELVRHFMEGRSSRFGSYALVKLHEAVAIGAALVIYALRGSRRGRVGGHARAVCPKETRLGKLNASLIAAEVGIFEGVSAGLSMNQIRSVKGCFATEVSPSTMSVHGGSSLSWTLSNEEVKHFCVSRKTLLPGAVDRVMQTHCRDGNGMKLAEFSTLLCVLGDITTDGALDYFFTVVDVDADDKWRIADLRHFHMEKERLCFKDGIAVSDLQDFWINLLDMVGKHDAARRGVCRRDIFKLGSKDRKAVIQTLLYVDDDYISVNIQRTNELRNSASPVNVI